MIAVARDVAGALARRDWTYIGRQQWRLSGAPTDYERVLGEYSSALFAEPPVGDQDDEVHVSQLGPEAESTWVVAHRLWSSNLGWTDLEVRVIVRLEDNAISDVEIYDLLVP